MFPSPVFVAGWGAEYPDPHNLLHAFMHSRGFYGKYTHHANASSIDRLIEKGLAIIEPSKRKDVYERLQHLWYEDAMGLCIYQPISIRYYRDWGQGVILHPLDSDASEWLFRLWKEKTSF